MLTVFSFCLGLSNSQYSYIKHCFLLLLQILDIFYSICFIILISMIAGNLIEIRLPKIQSIQSRKCLQKFNWQQ
jgi:hypothetical protein